MLGSFRSGLNLSSGVDGARYGIHVPYCVSYCGGGRFWRWDGDFEGAAACGRASWALVRWEPKDQRGGTEEKK
jgi:hypothetical protein